MTAVLAEPLVRVEGLRTCLRTGRRTVTVVDDVTLEIEPQHVVALLGESGSGKTMTALSILGLLPPGGFVAEGHIWYRGDDLVRLPPAAMRGVRGKEIAIIFQNPRDRLDPVFTVGRQLVEVLLLHGVCASKREARRRATDLLREVRIARPTRVVDMYPHELSGGMLQRVTIAMAISTSPDVLIADEPTSALDVTIQSDILDLLASLRESRGMAMLFITHDILIARHIADTIAVMYAGQIVEYGAADGLLASPRHPYTEALLACVPTGAPGEQLTPIPGQAASIHALPTGCRFAPRCASFARHGKQSPPPLVAEHGRLVRCWLYAESA